MDQNNRLNATVARSRQRVSRLFMAFVTLVLPMTFVSLGGCGKSGPPEDAAGSPSGTEPLQQKQAMGVDADGQGDRIQGAGGVTVPDANPGEPVGGGIRLPSESEIKKMREAHQSGDKQPNYQLPDDLDIKPIEPPPLSKRTSSRPRLDFASWEEIQSIASVPGKVTVLDLWSLSCEPCMKEFPQLVKMHQAMGDRVRCVAVNLDFDGRRSRPPESYQARVTTFLQSVQAGDLETYLCKTPNDEVYSEAKIPSLPAVLVFDRNGKWLQSFVDAGETSGFHYETDVFPLVEKLASVSRMGVN